MQYSGRVLSIGHTHYAVHLQFVSTQYAKKNYKADLKYGIKMHFFTTKYDTFSR